MGLQGEELGVQNVQIWETDHDGAPTFWDIYGFEDGVAHAARTTRGMAQYMGTLAGGRIVAGEPGIGWREAIKTNYDIREAIRRSRFALGRALSLKMGTFWLSEDDREAVSGRLKYTKVHVGDDAGDILTMSVVEPPAAAMPPKANPPQRGEVRITPGSGITAEERVMSTLECVYRDLWTKFCLNIFRGIPDLPWAHAALAEHIALALKNGRPEIIHPDERKEYPHEADAPFAANRRLFAAVSHGTDPSLWTRAYSGDAAARNMLTQVIGASRTAAHRLLVAVTTALGPDQPSPAAMNALALRLELGESIGGKTSGSRKGTR